MTSLILFQTDTTQERLLHGIAYIEKYLSSPHLVKKLTQSDIGQTITACYSHISRWYIGDTIKISDDSPFTLTSVLWILACKLKILHDDWAAILNVYINDLRQQASTLQADAFTNCKIKTHDDLNQMISSFMFHYHWEPIGRLAGTSKAINRKHDIFIQLERRVSAYVLFFNDCSPVLINKIVRIGFWDRIFTDVITCSDMKYKTISELEKSDSDAVADLTSKFYKWGKDIISLDVSDSLTEPYRTTLFELALPLGARNVNSIVETETLNEIARKNYESSVPHVLKTVATIDGISIQKVNLVFETIHGITSFDDLLKVFNDPKHSSHQSFCLIFFDYLIKNWVRPTDRKTFLSEYVILAERLISKFDRLLSLNMTGPRPIPYRPVLLSYGGQIFVRNKYCWYECDGWVSACMLWLHFVRRDFNGELEDGTKTSNLTRHFK